MTTSLSRLSVGLVMLAVMALLAGCDSASPEPSEDAVYYFLANARLGGGMRVCWPAGQEYAVGITKALAGLQSELDKIRGLLSYGSEWPKDDPRWQDTQAVEQHATELAELAAEESADARRRAFAAIGGAIDKLPDGLSFATDDAREAFKQRLWSALAITEGDIEQLESLLETRIVLFEAVRACAGSFDKKDGTLRFTDPECQRAVEEAYDALADRVEAERETFFAHASQRIAEITPIIKEIDKQKQRDEYNLLDNERSYIRDRIDEMKRELRELIRQHQKTLAQLEKEKTKSAPSVLQFHERRIKTLQAELARVEERGAAILNPQP